MNLEYASCVCVCELEAFATGSGASKFCTRTGVELGQRLIRFQTKMYE
jgi:hypothetical protein